MALPGREPKDRRLGRTPLAEWTEVDDVQQPPRKLPSMHGVKWRAPVLRWWATISSMPHTVLWTDSDWLFAEDTALMKQQWLTLMLAKNPVVQSTLAAEIRRREDQMGTTVEARRKLRVRYVQPQAVEPIDPAAPAAVASLADRRRRLTGA